MTFGFGFCLILCGEGFGLIPVLVHFLLLGSVLGKTWVLVWFVLAGFRFFPISRLQITE